MFDIISFYVLSIAFAVLVAINAVFIRDFFKKGVPSRVSNLYFSYLARKNASIPQRVVSAAVYCTVGIGLAWVGLPMVGKFVLCVGIWGIFERIPLTWVLQAACKRGLLPGHVEV